MIVASVADLKSDAEKYLDAVARGETVEVCRDGKPVAVLAPLPKRDPDYWKRPIEPLELEGVSLSQLIVEEREESP